MKGLAFAVVVLFFVALAQRVHGGSNPHRRKQERNMAETFHRGEIAIYCGGVYHAEYNGQECIVDSELEWRFPTSPVTGGLVQIYGYKTIARDGNIFTCRPDQLKKRRPPQDWVSICNLDVVTPERELEIA